MVNKHPNKHKVLLLREIQMFYIYVFQQHTLFLYDKFGIEETIWAVR